MFIFLFLKAHNSTLHSGRDSVCKSVLRAKGKKSPWEIGMKKRLRKHALYQHEKCLGVYWSFFFFLVLLITGRGVLFFFLLITWPNGKPFFFRLERGRRLHYLCNSSFTWLALRKKVYLLLVYNPVGFIDEYTSLYMHINVGRTFFGEIGPKVCVSGRKQSSQLRHVQLQIEASIGREYGQIADWNAAAQLNALVPRRRNKKKNQLDNNHET